MLASMLMPQEPPTPSHLATTTMSVALLPSYSPSSPSPSKRPKLSINTADVPSSAFGKGSTSLRLETLSATSPTSRNTFKNAYKPVSITRSNRPILTLVATNTSRSLPERTTSEESDSSTSTLDASPRSVPYKIAYNITSILSNSPLPRKRSRTAARTMFPAIKRVAFRTPLTEDVKNSRFTLKHSDIESSTSTISTLELSPPETQGQNGNDNKKTINQKMPSKRKDSPPPSKRESPNEDDEDSFPSTPIAGRNKRSRQWTWTLGPVGTEPKTSATESQQGSSEKDTST